VVEFFGKGGVPMTDTSPFFLHLPDPIAYLSLMTTDDRKMAFFGKIVKKCIYPFQFISLPMKDMKGHEGSKPLFGQNTKKMHLPISISHSFQSAIATS
jgi:hypothetical protein